MSGSVLVSQALEKRSITPTRHIVIYKASSETAQANNSLHLNVILTQLQLLFSGAIFYYEAWSKTMRISISAS